MSLIWVAIVAVTRTSRWLPPFLIKWCQRSSNGPNFCKLILNEVHQCWIPPHSASSKLRRINSSPERHYPNNVIVRMFDQSWQLSHEVAVYKTSLTPFKSLNPVKIDLSNCPKIHKSIVGTDQTSEMSIHYQQKIAPDVKTPSNHLVWRW